MDGRQSEAINKLVEQRNRLNARIEQIRNKELAEERKRDTRRKILAGAYFIKLMGGNLEKVGETLLDDGMLEERDFELFLLDMDKNDEARG